MSKKTIALYVTPAGEIWATSRDLKGAYAVRQDTGDMAHLLGHFGHIQPRTRVDDDYLADPEDIAGHAFGWIAYDNETDKTSLELDATVVSSYAREVMVFLTGVRLIDEVQVVRT